MDELIDAWLGWTDVDENALGQEHGSAGSDAWAMGERPLYRVSGSDPGWVIVRGDENAARVGFTAQGSFIESVGTDVKGAERVDVRRPPSRMCRPGRLREAGTWARSSDVLF